MPTILEACGIRAPEEVDGIKQAPIEGVSFAYTFDRANANVASKHKTQYFEMMGDHAIYHEGWIASTKVIRPPWEVVGPVNQDPFNNCTWELYDLGKDWTQYERCCGQISGEAQGDEGSLRPARPASIKCSRWTPPSLPASSCRVRTSPQDAASSFTLNR